jgi:truncated hemoglobin YjbI
MERSLATVQMPDDQREQLWSYLEMAAHSMVNTLDDPS